MNRPFVFYLTFLLTIVSLTHAHSLSPSSSLNSCQSLERLNHTVYRVSPILEGLLHLQTDNGKTAGATSNRTVRVTKDLGDVVPRIRSVQYLLGKSNSKISDKLLSCREPSSSAVGVLARSEQSGGEGTGNDDSGDDDEQCTLDKVVDEMLDELTDSVECLLSITSTLLGGVLDLALNLLSGIVQLIGELLDLD
ncbi:hypothetical protein BDV25DRAFT_64181 [Aspergillus avenaceus]|uniref:Hydrophobic surface binding protein A-domain-containing protein n=1 Tax=Aspergillus avenaceus TaxID=36643 RepID=A0A5N6U8N0_ASPAV|nr:hypothetical protein BDV25DRAFT_64181 [Aspergillus avenaceus]